MAYGLNKVMLIGNVGQDPEMKYTPQGTPVVSFSLATNESYKDQNGQLIERTEWHRCVAWRKAAETIGQYVHKGSKLYVGGKLQTRSWDDKEGNKRYTTEIVVDDFMFLDSKGAGGGGSVGGEPGGYDGPALPEEKGDDLPF